jgi:cytoskeletal protein CcmA (bactofilin family)
MPEIRKESLVSSTPHRVPEADSRNTATIGKAVKIVGQIYTKEDLNVDGDVEGTIESQDNKVTIGTTGRVQASVKAREVVIFGQVQGNVEAADKVDIRREAKLVGDITTARISIEDGALFKGSIDIRKPEPKPGTPATTTTPAASTSSMPASGSSAAPPVTTGAPVSR